MHLNNVKRATARVALEDLDAGIEKYADRPLNSTYPSGIKPTMNADGYYTSVMLDSLDGTDFELGKEKECSATLLPGSFQLELNKKYELHSGKRRIGRIEFREFLELY